MFKVAQNNSVESLQTGYEVNLNMTGVAVSQKIVQHGGQVRVQLVLALNLHQNPLSLELGEDVALFLRNFLQISAVGGSYKLSSLIQGTQKSFYKFGTADLLINTASH